MNTKVSFWLVPSEADKAFFQDIIDSLAREYDAPSFTPHVTIYSGECEPDESPAELIDRAIQRIHTFALKVDKLLYTEEFTKSLFLQFQPSEILSQISETIQSNLRKPFNYSLNPHLSLIYKDLNEEIKKDLTNSIRLPKSEVLFNEVQAISTPEKVKRREDVESWKVICTRQFYA